MADPADRDWEADVRGLLRAELTRRGMTYSDLVDGLAKIGVKETVPNLKNKMSRGSFTAIFFIQCLRAMGVASLRLDEAQ